jgi:hypothetical protein
MIVVGPGGSTHLSTVEIAGKAIPATIPAQISQWGRAGRD